MSINGLKTWLGAQWEWFKSFFSEETGGSTTRALNWIWMITLCLNLTIITSYNIYKHKADAAYEAKLPPIEATSGYVAITSLLLAAKVGQRIWGENPVTGEPPVSGSALSATSPVTGSVSPS